MTWNDKIWWKSKTLWVGGLQIIGGVMLTLSSEIAAGGVLTLAGFVQIALRVISSSTIVKR